MYISGVITLIELIMKKVFVAATLALFVGSMSANVYAATSGNHITVVKKDDDKKKKKKSTKKGCKTKGGSCCSKKAA